jgi:hypothetical protein
MNEWDRIPPVGNQVSIRTRTGTHVCTVAGYRRTATGRWVIEVVDRLGHTYPAKPDTVIDLGPSRS